MNDKIIEIRLPAPSEETIKEVEGAFKFLYGDDTKRTDLYTPHTMTISFINGREFIEPLTLEPGYYVLGCVGSSLYYRKTGEREIKIARLK